MSDTSRAKTERAAQNDATKLSRRAVLKSVPLLVAGLALSSSVQGAQGEHMKITVITGSPHKNGTSALLADEFIKGAREAGHEVFRFNAAFEKISPCLGCDACGMGSADCVQNDAMANLKPHLLAANLVVFVTPLYYYGFSAQIKTVIDRFYAVNTHLMGSGKKAMLLATSWNNANWTMESLVMHYQTLVRYERWTDAGMLLATGCGTRPMIEASEYPAKAYQMGKNLRSA